MTRSGSPPGADHDHRLCVEAAIADAQAICAARGGRLTALRRRVLELVWASHRPVGAYAILDALDRRGGAGAPPTVYRALEFLLAHGLIHRIESLNAYVGCSRPGHRNAGQFLICLDCGNAAELDGGSVAAAVVAEATRLGFAVERQTVEVSGLCADCTVDPEAADVG
ncbi:MAG: Fur family transcriptional regulator [Alphaproteobacteria bacterium]